jgi:hypothetical protein
LFRTVVYLFIFLGLVWVACSNNFSNLAVKEGIDVVAIIGPDYRNQGKVPYESFEGIIVSSTGCEVAYTYFRPSVGAQEVPVILGHGFMRSKKRMEPLAQHLASWGLSVVNVESCNSKFWAGNHDRNGADMVAVAEKIGTCQVIYAGFSAGGLAALVAANLDSNTLAFFGLDMVDNKGLGKKIAQNLTVPFYGLVAAPSACNANNNGLDSYALAQHSNVIKVEDTSHCHFEFPVDGKCSFMCGKGETRFSREMIQQSIFGLTTAFLLWQTGIDTNGETWWTDNQLNYSALRDAGIIKKPTNYRTGSKEK